MIDTKDVKRIVECKKQALEELAKPEIWDLYTKNMECGELKAFKQSCTDSEIIIEALEKQIPKKVIRKDENGYSLASDIIKCPCCGRLLSIMYAMNYCKECGQALDWGQEDDR